MVSKSLWSILKIILMVYGTVFMIVHRCLRFPHLSPLRLSTPDSLTIWKVGKGFPTFIQEVPDLAACES